MKVKSISQSGHVLLKLLSGARMGVILHGQAAGVGVQMLLFHDITQAMICLSK